MKGTKTLLSYILFIVGIQYKVICRLPPPVCERDHFTCDNQDCIPLSWKCDGADDCGDNSDENDCPVGNGEECDADEMKCNNGRCITLEFKCDSEDDCGDNSDETNCTSTHHSRPCDESTNFRCANGKCIPRSYTCNKVDDCGDSSDEATDKEPNCVPFAGCKDGYFQCNVTKNCIHNVLTCDYTYNCGTDKNGVLDKSDELYCSQRTCETGEFKCANGRCISSQWRCDKQNDCGDSSDERNCSFKTCGENKFRCARSGHCIDAKNRCDNFKDCIDGSDEEGCPSTTSPPFTRLYTEKQTAPPTAAGCKTDEYKCRGENKCLKQSWICDGEADCRHGDDESADVCSTHRCQVGHFQCKNGRCIAQRNVCDGHDHCGDNTDEKNCTKAVVPCGKNTHQCKGSSKCIPLTSVCDRRIDCPFEDDEDDKCGINECLKNNGNCSSICIDLPIGHKCACPKGYELDNGKCVDVNECHIFGKCSQDCKNYKGSFACECEQGYSMDTLDNRTCRADGPKPWLYFTNDFDIRASSLDGKEVKLVTRTQHANSLAVSYKDKVLYWSDVKEKTISRMSLDGSLKTEVIVKDLAKTEGIALDYIGNKLYWTNTQDEAGENVDQANFFQLSRLEDNEIGVMDLNGMHQKVLYKAGDHEIIRSVAVYPEKGYLFWTNWGGHSKIERTNLDGSNKKTLIDTGVVWPTDLTIDKTNDRLYWTDASSIYTIRVDGTGFKRILNNLKRPFGIAVFEDTMYWTDYVERKMYRANKFNGLHKQMMAGTYAKPLDIEVYHPVMEKAVNHPCHHDNGGCSHLCFMTPDSKAVCACPGIMKLDAAGKKCIAPIIPTTTPKPTTVKKLMTTTSTTQKPTTVKVTTVAPETTTVEKTTVRVTEKPTTTIKVETTKKPETTLKIVATTQRKETTVAPKTDVETAEPVVVVNQQKRDEETGENSEGGTTTVYIIVGVLCLIGTLSFIVFGVVCLRKKRRQFGNLSMVYEPQRDVVHEKDEKEEKDKDISKYIIPPKKSAGFDNVNFKNTNGAVHIPVNMEEDMTDEMLSDNSSEDICFDDRAPILDNML